MPSLPNPKVQDLISRDYGVSPLKVISFLGLTATLSTPTLLGLLERGGSKLKFVK